MPPKKPYKKQVVSKDQVQDSHIIVESVHRKTPGKTVGKTKPKEAKWTIEVKKEGGKKEATSGREQVKNEKKLYVTSAAV
jgi:hypothetical protein